MPGAERLLGTIEALEATLVANRATILALKRELADRRATHKLRPQVVEVFEHWRARCAPRARELNGKRFDAVAARLNAGHSVGRIKRAIDGAAARPYVVGSGIRSATGKRSERHVGLELICRDEDHLDRFISYAPPLPDVETFHQIVERLEVMGLMWAGSPDVDAGGILTLVARCPCCLLATLHVREHFDDEGADVFCAHGCEQPREALRHEWVVDPFDIYVEEMMRESRERAFRKQVRDLARHALSGGRLELVA